MTPNAVGVTTPGSTASPAGAGASPVAAGPESAPVAADFLALLLLTLGLGSGTSQSEAETKDAAAGDDGETPTPAVTTDPTALAATAPIAVAATMPMTTPLPIAAPIPPDGASPQSARTIDGSATIAGGATIDGRMTIEIGSAIDAGAPGPTTIGRPDTKSTPRASARGEATVPSDTPVAATEAHHALAELGSENSDAVADAKVSARSEIVAETTSASSPAPAPRPVIDTNARPSVSADDSRGHEHEAAGAAPTTAKTQPVTAATRPEPVAPTKPETAERHQAPEPRPAMPQHGSDIVALGAHTEPPARGVTSEAALGASAASSPAAVEPHVVTDQVVRAARLVVDGGLAQMRVDLDPPVLGAVRVQADVRGEVVMLTITAERPETQALLTQALPDIQQALVRRDVGPTSVAIIGSTATPLSSDGRRAPERRPETPRERPTPQPGERRRTLHASRGVSALDITV